MSLLAGTPVLMGLRVTNAWFTSVLPLFSLGLVLSLAGCQSSRFSSVDLRVMDDIQEHASAGGSEAAAGAVGEQPPEEILEALVPGLQFGTEAVEPVEERFDFSVTEPMDIRAFFSLLTEGTDESIVVHPNVQGQVSALDLKNVTTEEVLDLISSFYGVVIERSGGIYQVLPGGLQTRIFSVNYLNITRSGSSNMQITASGISQNELLYGGYGAYGGVGRSGRGGLNNLSPTPNLFGLGGGLGGIPGTGGVGGLGGLGGYGGLGGLGTNTGGASINTRNETDYWDSLEDTLRSIIDAEESEREEGSLLGGSRERERRSVIVSPQTGMVVVRAYPDELRQVEEFLRVSQNALNRQVILEAKILEVELEEGFQAGIDLNTLGDRANGPDGDGTIATSDNEIAAEFGFIGENDLSSLSNPFTLSLNYTDFDGVIRLLETQGNVQVISSPRIATLNNQKAVFKVGREEYFLTNANTTSFGAGQDLTTNQNTDLQPFFSGIALDVTPQISEQGDIILHIHPILSQVTEDQKLINGQLFPLANSSTRESDSVARTRHGEVIVISGLMQTRSQGEEAGVPGLNDIPLARHAFEQKQRETVKTELVILLRALVDQDDSMQTLMDEHADRLDSLRRQMDSRYRRSP